MASFPSTPLEKLEEKFIVNKYEALGLCFKDFDTLWSFVCTTLENPDIKNFGITSKEERILKSITVGLQVRSGYEEEIQIPEKYLSLNLIPWLATQQDLGKLKILKTQYKVLPEVFVERGESLVVAYQIMNHLNLSTVSTLPYLEKEWFPEQFLTKSMEAFLTTLQDQDMHRLQPATLKHLLDTYFPNINIPSLRLHTNPLGTAVYNNQYEYVDFLIKEMGALTYYKKTDPQFEGVKSAQLIQLIEDHSPIFHTNTPQMLKLLSGAKDFDINAKDYSGNILTNKLSQRKRHNNLEEFVAVLYSLGFDFEQEMKHATGEKSSLKDVIEKKDKNYGHNFWSIIETVLSAIKEKEAFGQAIPELSSTQSQSPIVGVKKSKI